MFTRLSKVIALATYGLMFLLAAIGNITDYDSNFMFVQHVLSMDTVFATTTLKSRAITSPAVHHALYALIIATEFVVATLCLAGAAKLLRFLRTPVAFHEAKRLGVLGLLVGLTLSFGGFYVIGSEWFASWQSKTWSATVPGLRLTGLTLLVMLLLFSTDTDRDA